jgi:hypothetical protein
LPDTVQVAQLEVQQGHCHPHVAVCVATCRRPEGLKRLLQGLETLAFRAIQPASVRVIVVDNDPRSGAGIQACRDLGKFRWDLRVLPEERRGISFARNRAVQEAFDLGAHAMVFIDDDEVPDPGWLDGLLQVQASTGAEAVSGPVLPWFEEPVPAWVVQGGFFDRPRCATGAEIDFARTGNLLLDAKFLRKAGLSFNDGFGISGGSDSLLTMQLRQRGARIVWADEAVVREWVPRERAKARYILRREFARGSNWARIEGALHPGPLVALRRGFIGGARIAQGGLAIPSLLLGRHAVVKWAAKACMGAGMLAGLFRVRARLYQ